MAAIRTIALPSGEVIPALGQGTWHMAEDVRRRADELETRDGCSKNWNEERG